ncbi:Tetratricopeptide repeat protein 29 [Galemys pyrenaicus]|uniref:Tetratricopeptide repeat protein 29 n=1 Tax=Galemys pyrenaicus TaxID=202257 RepID=A0A8J6AJH7_GALPY|nr:Tetratricopeptide repeat protein 29 [Galemys pyrenaicus]
MSPGLASPRLSVALETAASLLGAGCAGSREPSGRRGGAGAQHPPRSTMTALPPLPITRPKLTSLARQKLPCSPRSMPRSQLIKEKDDIDHYVEVNFKGLSKEEVAA